MKGFLFKIIEKILSKIILIKNSFYYNIIYKERLILLHIEMHSANAAII